MARGSAACGSGVEANDSIEAGRREVDLGNVGTDERGARDKPTGTFDLDIADVHPGDLVPGRREVPCDRDTASAPDVQDLAVPGKAMTQIS
ncbi:MAG TPA: hypothetical protein VN969_07735 [Streptosporangiaceae bacterium]|nr:hypothetical protein [Streptosporangiaceae bacterium]